MAMVMKKTTKNVIIMKGKMLMIKIGIVDDDECVLEEARACIESIDNLPEDVEIAAFCSSEDFLSKIEENDTYDILFTDIQMDGMDGLELGLVARKRFPHIYLIILTAYATYAVDSYMIDADQYILKSQMEERIPSVIRKMILEIQKKRKKFRIIETANGSVKIFYQDIISIKKVKGSKYVEYTTIRGSFKERVGLEQLMEEMNCKAFIFAERGYVVNIRHVACIEKNVISMDNDDRITISRGRLVEVRMKINEQWGDV